MLTKLLKFRAEDFNTHTHPVSGTELSDKSYEIFVPVSAFCKERASPSKYPPTTNKEMETQL
jgi:hypothetical protein